MSVDYITGREKFPTGSEPGTGVIDVQILENVDLVFGDSEELKFGDLPDVIMRWDGTIFETLPAVDDTGAFNIGDGTYDMDFKVFLGTTTDYVLADVGSKTLSVIVANATGSSEHNATDIEVTSDNTYLTGTNLTYSGAKGSAMVKLVGTASMASGGFEGIDIKIASSGAFSTDGNGIMGVKCVVTNSVALSDGEMYGGQFIAKHASTGTMLATASLIGLEAWAYISSSGPARTCIGGNFGWHNECTGAYGAGSVIRGIQIFCDNASGAQVPVESTGLCIWNQAGTITNAINVVSSGSGFTYLLAITSGKAPVDSVSLAGLGDNESPSGTLAIQVGSDTRYIPYYAAA